MTSIMTMEDIDRKMAEQKRRFAERPEQEIKGPVGIHSIEDLPPFSKEMVEAFQLWAAGEKYSAKCPSCGWLITTRRGPAPVVLPHSVGIMGEQIPLPTVLCKKCGIMFVPKFALEIVNRAGREATLVLERMELAQKTNEEQDGKEMP